MEKGNFHWNVSLNWWEFPQLTSCAVSCKRGAAWVTRVGRPANSRAGNSDRRIRASRPHTSYVMVESHASCHSASVAVRNLNVPRIFDYNFSLFLRLKVNTVVYDCFVFVFRRIWSGQLVVHSSLKVLCGIMLGRLTSVCVLMCLLQRPVFTNTDNLGTKNKFLVFLHNY